MDLVALGAAKKEAGFCKRGQLPIQRVGRLAGHARNLAHVVRLAGMQQQQAENIAPVGAEKQIGEIHRVEGEKSLVAKLATIIAYIATTVKVVTDHRA